MDKVLGRVIAMSKDEVILYLETADGDTMRVPESKLKDFCLLDEKIKAKMQQKEKKITYTPNFDDAIRATEKMFEQEQIIQEKEEKIQRLMYDINVLRASNQQMQGTIEELSRKNEEHLIEQGMLPPELDIDGLAFADSETQKAEMDKYTKQLIEYIKRKDDI